MKLHPRAAIATKARLDMSEAIIAVADKYDLTYVELFLCLNEITAGWIKYAIRTERHSYDPDKRGGEE